VVEWILSHYSYVEARKEISDSRVMMIKYSELIESEESFKEIMKNVKEFTGLKEHEFSYIKIRKPRNISKGDHIE
jgi:hypothetical protein